MAFCKIIGVVGPTGKMTGSVKVSTGGTPAAAGGADRGSEEDISFAPRPVFSPTNPFLPLDETIDAERSASLDHVLYTAYDRNGDRSFNRPLFPPPKRAHSSSKRKSTTHGCAHATLPVAVTHDDIEKAHTKCTTSLRQFKKMQNLKHIAVVTTTIIINFIITLLIHFNMRLPVALACNVYRPLPFNMYMHNFTTNYTTYSDFGNDQSNYPLIERNNTHGKEDEELYNDDEYPSYTDWNNEDECENDTALPSNEQYYNNYIITNSRTYLIGYQSPRFFFRAHSSLLRILGADTNRENYIFHGGSAIHILKPSHGNVKLVPKQSPLIKYIRHIIKPFILHGELMYHVGSLEVREIEEKLQTYWSYLIMYNKTEPTEFGDITPSEEVVLNEIFVYNNYSDPNVSIQREKRRAANATAEAKAEPEVYSADELKALAKELREGYQSAKGTYADYVAKRDAYEKARAKNLFGSLCAYNYSNTLSTVMRLHNSTMSVNNTDKLKSLDELVTAYFSLFYNIPVGSYQPHDCDWRHTRNSIHEYLNMTQPHLQSKSPSLTVHFIKTMYGKLLLKFPWLIGTKGLGGYEITTNHTIYDPSKSPVSKEIYLAEFKTDYNAMNEPLVMAKRAVPEAKLAAYQGYDLSQITQDRYKKVITELMTPAELKAISSQRNSFYNVAYDCTKPVHNPIPTSSFIQDECEAPASISTTLEGEKDPPVRYQVIQTERNRKIKGFRCEKTVTRVVSYCGWYAHSTPLPDQSFYARKVRLTKNESISLVHHQEYIDATGKAHHVAKDTNYILDYFEAGGTILYDNGEVGCNFDTAKVAGKTMYRLVIHEEQIISWRDELIVQREDDSLVAFYQNVRLNCPLEHKYCRVGPTTFMWPLDGDNYCPAKVARETTGTIIHDPNHVNKVYMSTDNTGIRIVVKEPTMLCGKKVYKTSYPNVYMYPLNDGGGEPVVNRFTEKVAPADIDLGLYITNRDDYLYNALQQKLRAEFNDVLISTCKQRAKLEHVHEMVTREHPGLHTYSFGGNSFLTTSGEVTYAYECRPLLVQAVEAPHCYDALPVQVLSRKRNESSTNITGHQELPTLFMDPLTHKLSRTATPIACTKGLYHMYQDIWGRWFSITPDLIKQDVAPEQIPIITLQQLNYTKEDAITTSSWGMYTTDQIRAMSDYLEFPRVTQAVVSKLAGQIGDMTPTSYITPQSLFPSFTLEGGSWTSFILGKFWGWLSTMGSYTGIALFLYYSIHWSLELFKCIMSFSHFFDRYGWSLNLLYAICPGAHHSRQVQRDHRERRREVELEDVDDSGYHGYQDSDQMSVGTVEPTAPIKRGHFQMPRDFHILFNTNVLEGLDETRIPVNPTQQEIDQGSLRNCWDLAHHGISTIRDNYLSKLPTAPIIDVDLREMPNVMHTTSTVI